MEWTIYKGTSRPHDGIIQLPSPPPWRRFAHDIPESGIHTTPDSEFSKRDRARGESYLPSAEAIALVNAALYLRRPLIVEGKPGTGKSTLAYAVAHELKLGPVLHWPITSSSTIQQGLYRYDALGRLQEAKFREEQQKAPSQESEIGESSPGKRSDDIGRYVQLGPLGTALLPWKKPRVLLIDEIDKSDIDLPNDLLNIFEDGMFIIPELRRHPAKTVVVRTEDSSEAVVVEGRITCNEFPLVILTNNGMREFPPAFMRRCLPLNLALPDASKLAQIIRAHFQSDETQQNEQISQLIRTFLQRRDEGDLATDQLMNAIFLTTHGPNLLESKHEQLLKAIMRHLSVRV